MSNEEIVLAIQAGKNNMMEKLWEQTRKFIAYKARSAILKMGQSARVEVDDMIQDAYFALVAAVMSYKPDRGDFIGWLSLYLKTSFAFTAGFRSSKQRSDPMRYALSVDEKIGDDEDSDSFVEYVPNHEAEQMMKNVEDDLFTTQLRKNLDSAINEIPEKYGSVVRKRYFEGKTLKSIAGEIGVSQDYVRQLEKQGIKKLRNPKSACQLLPFWEFDCYLSTGLQSFRNKGASGQELYMILMENRTERAAKAAQERRKCSMDAIHGCK